MTDARDIVYGLLDLNPMSRFNCLQTKNHRWVKGYTAARRNEERRGQHFIIQFVCEGVKFRFLIGESQTLTFSVSYLMVREGFLLIISLNIVLLYELW